MGVEAVINGTPFQDLDGVRVWVVVVRFLSHFCIAYFKSPLAQKKTTLLGWFDLVDYSPTEARFAN